MHVPESWHPFESVPPGQGLALAAHEIGHKCGHGLPSFPGVPSIGTHVPFIGQPFASDVMGQCISVGVQSVGQYD